MRIEMHYGIQVHYVFFALISTKRTTFQRQFVEILCTEFHLNQSRNMESKALVTETAVTKLTLARQLLAKNSYIEIHENLAHGLVR
jgi:hypothetical protein